MATRYWVGGGSSTNWDATGNTNWGTASGVQDNASVPTATDDVIFDGGGGAGVGDSDSVISATITVLSLTITSGYTSTMTHNAVLTVAGNITFGANYIIAGTAELRSSATCTITSNGITWPNNMTFSGNNTRTLVGNLIVSGTFATSGGTSGLTVINATTTETLTIGGLTVQGAISGTADIYLTGGTWSASLPSPTVNSNLFINGNVTFSGNIYKSNNTLTYLSGTVTTTGSTLNIGASTTLNTNGINWNNLTTTGTNTITLTSNLTIGGLLTITATTTINRTTAETITLNGGITLSGAGLSGTADINWTGGTWSQVANTYGIANNVNINGNVVVSAAGPAITGGTWTYLSGTVTTSGSTLTIRGANCTLNLNGITWNNVFLSASGVIVTLTSNFVMSGQLSVFSTATINRTTAETVTIAGGMTISAAISGTADVYLTGGTWSGGSSFANNLFINGNVTISGSVAKSANTLTYSSGSVTTTGSTLNLTGDCTLNTSGMSWNNITATLVYNAQRSITLTSDLNVNGLFYSNTAGGVTAYILRIQRTTAEVVNCFGGITVTGNSSSNSSANLSGTADIYLKGGTWSTTTTGDIANNLYIDGNVTVSGIVWYRSGSLNYVSGTVTTTGSTLNINRSCTLNTNGITWNNVQFVTANSTSITLSSDITINGLFATDGGFPRTMTATGGAIMYINGGMNHGNNLTGNYTIYFQGGTWSNIYRVGGNVYFNGNVTLSGNVRWGDSSRILKYLSGVVTTTGSTFTIDNGSFDTYPIVWNNISYQFSGGSDLLSDLIVSGFINGNGSGYVFNTSNNSKIIMGGGIFINGNFTGTAPIVWTGGTWSQLNTTFRIGNPISIEGNVTIGSNACYGGSGLTYVYGKVTTDNRPLRVVTSSTINNFNRTPLASLIATAGITMTFNQMPVGTEERILDITSTGANYTIAFTDTFEKIGRNVAISGATLSRPHQLLVATSAKFNTNRSTNALGIRYFNQSPNGFDKNTLATADRTLTGVQGGLWADPCFQRQG